MILDFIVFVVEWKWFFGVDIFCFKSLKIVFYDGSFESGVFLFIEINCYWGFEFVWLIKYFCFLL